MDDTPPYMCLLNLWVGAECTEEVALWQAPQCSRMSKESHHLQAVRYAVLCMISQSCQYPYGRLIAVPMCHAATVQLSLLSSLHSVQTAGSFSFLVFTLDTAPPPGLLAASFM